MQKIVTTDITDPYINLAIENQLLMEVEDGQRHLFIYQNRPCVIIGRFQNPYIECHLEKMHQHNIELIRRQSGGGTVYHDLNNVNFSFIADKKLHDQNFNHGIVVNALRSLNINAYATARGDIRLADGTDRKISGSAFKQKKDQAFHHGTMLVNSNIEKLNHFIHSEKVNLKTKSIPSTRSTVANINEINKKVSNKEFIQALVNHFENECEEFERIHISQSSSLDQSIYQYAEKLKDLDWKFYETPKFYVNEVIKFIDENIEINLTIKKLKIDSVEIISQHLYPPLIVEFERILTGQKISFNFIKDCSKLYDYDRHLSDELNKWFNQYFNLSYYGSL